MKLRAFITSLILLTIPLSMQAAAVSPATIDLVGGRGEIVTSKFVVINMQATEQTYYLDTLSFQAKDESGEPAFDQNESANDLSKWIVFVSDRVVVPANSKVDVPFSIQIPADVASQSYQSAITVSSAPADIVATNGAIIEAKTAILVFLTVNGDSTKKAALLDFVGSGKEIQLDLHQTFTYRIQNQGNVYAIPEGTITIKDFLGRTIQTRNAGEAKHRVLPMTTRSFQVTSEKPSGFMDTLNDETSNFAIGPMTASLSLSLGEGFQSIQASYSFIYIPYRLFLSVLALATLIFLGFQALSKHKKT